MCFSRCDVQSFKNFLVHLLRPITLQRLGDLLRLLRINFKLEEMYDAIVWVIMTVRQASVFDANNFCHHISQLTQLMSGNIPHPERSDQMIYIEQGEESLPHFSNSREESL